MTHDAYTLTFSHESFYSGESKFAPESLFASAMLYSLAVSMSNNLYALALASVLPIIILCMKKSLPPSFLKLNAINLIMLFTLALTWPSFTEGLMIGMLITLRLNMIYIIFAFMIFPLGITRIYEALANLGIPEKLRVLIILTLRGIFILHDRLEAALISVKLRAPNLREIMKLKVFAYVIAGVLLQSSRRSEHMMLAVICRGGFGGFAQSERGRLKAEDAIMVLGFAAYAGVILICNYA